METRAQAQAAIAAGTVIVDGAPARKASQPVGPDAVIKAAPAHPYVSRAALKLAHGLEVFAVEVTGRFGLDIGASTGGFTQVLLERGAAGVLAVDVGRGQLHPGIKRDPRVVDLSPRDARTLTHDDLSAPGLAIGDGRNAPAIVVCDASFIGLVKVIAQPLALVAPGSQAVVLFKPQFEVGPGHVGRGGIVTDPQAVEAALSDTLARLAAMGWACAGRVDSPILGGDGNREILLHLTPD